MLGLPRCEAASDTGAMRSRVTGLSDSVIIRAFSFFTFSWRRRNYMIRWRRALACIVTLSGMCLAIPACQHDKSDGGSAERSNKSRMSIEVSDFGKTKEGESVQLYTMTNAHGMVA